MSPSSTVEWQVCGLCNYNCTYCIQSARYRVGAPSPEEQDRMLDLLARLPEVWEIKMTGGEPFAFPDFMGRIVPGLIEGTPHRVSLLTNLSAPVPVLERFATLTLGRLGIVSASLHLEHTTVPRFLSKAIHLRQIMDPTARLVVNAVAVPGRLAALQRARDQVQAAGLRFFPQIMKIKAGLASYGEGEKPLFEDIFGQAPTTRQANMAPSFLGRRCHAGSRYFVLTQTGEAWSCRAARRIGEGFLGTAHEGGVSLREGPRPCTYPMCPCTTPANRGMIEGVGDGERPVAA